MCCCMPLLEWYCLDFWSERLDIDIPALKMSLKHKVAFRDGAVEFLAFLRRQNKKVFLVTNAHRKTLEIKFTRLIILSYVNDRRLYCKSR